MAREIGANDYELENTGDEILEFEATVTLKEDPSLARSKISLKAMLRVIRKEGGGMLVEFDQAEKERELDEAPCVNFYTVC